MDLERLIERHALLEDGAYYLTRLARIAKALEMEDTRKHFLEFRDAFKESQAATEEQIERLEAAEQKAILRMCFRSVEK